jgi:hypothetical protein
MVGYRAKLESGEFSLFLKVTGPDEVGERLDEGIEILKGMLTGINNLTMITQSGFEGLNSKMDGANCSMKPQVKLRD